MKKNRDRGKHVGDLVETFLAGNRGETRIHLRPVIVRPTGRGHEVLRRGTDDARRKRSRDLGLPALQELEQALGMLFLLVRGLSKIRAIWT